MKRNCVENNRQNRTRKSKREKSFVKMVCLAGVLFSMAGCSRKENIASNPDTEYLQEIGSGVEETEGTEKTVKPGENEQNYDLQTERDTEEVKEYLGAFPNELEELEKRECYIVLHGRNHSGRAYWDTFLKSTVKGEPAEVVLVQFTIEGDAILFYLQYNGTDYYVLKDFSRDAYAGSGERYQEGTYPYLSILEETAENGDYYQDIFLTDKENLTSELLEKYWNDEILQEEIDISYLMSIVAGNKSANITGDEVWHEVGTTFDESEILISTDQIKEIEVIDGNTGERIIIKDMKLQQEILALYENLDIMPNEELDHRVGYSYAMNLKDENGEMLQQVIPYKDAITIDGQIYDGSMNGTTIQLLLKLQRGNP